MPHTQWHTITLHKPQHSLRPWSWPTARDQWPSTTTLNRAIKAQPHTLPTMPGPASDHPAAHHCICHPAASWPVSTSHILTPHCNPCSRPINNSTTLHSPIPRPPMPIPATIDQYLAHLVAINNYQTVQQEANIPIPVSIPSSPTSSEPSKPSSSQKPSSSESDGTSDTQSTGSETSLQSTASSRQLCPQLQINYNETLLRWLHGWP